MKKVVIAIIAFTVLAAAAIFVVAQKAGHPGRGGFAGKGPGGPHMLGMMLKGLDLTDDQKSKVKEIMESSKTTVEPLMQQLRDNHAKLAGQGTDGKFDQVAVEAIASEQSGIMGKLIVEKEKAKAQIFALLTDEQKAKAAEMRARHQERMKGPKGFGRGHGELSGF